MAGFLARPSLTGLTVVDDATGELTVDIGWTGQENGVDLAHIRTRWVARVDGASSPAPDHTAASGWRESSSLRTEGDFRYIDTLEAATAAQMATSGDLSEDDETVTQSAFANATIWVMSRLEVA